MLAKSFKERIQEEADEQDGFNEKLLKTMCLNQAIGKLQKELLTLVSTRDAIIEIMEEFIESEKLENLLKQMK